MQISPLTFTPKRELTEAQRTRVARHAATVKETNGELATRVDTIITPKGLSKTVAYRTVSPSSAERVMSLARVPHLFEDLQHVNVILTNACNLSCSYCYEQHDTDYGRFTPDTLKHVYDFLLNCSDADGKVFQFFGGEPLVHKDLIVEFMNKYGDVLDENAVKVHVSMITNGTLLTPSFIETYFKHASAGMSVSLDTLDASVDHREIGQDKIDRIVEMIGLIPDTHKMNHRVSVRCTIAVETAPHVKSLAAALYHKGLRSMVIHPLTMSSIDGFISWDPAVWNQLHADILEIIRTFPGFAIQFSEGVGVKGGNNCMVGSDMIAVDGSGDYSGCYFFTNQKESVPHTILGNLLTGQVYVDRYLNFQDAYNQMFQEEEQCKACDLKGFCYQCPAGNADSGSGQLFRPDDMCQKIVQLFIDLQDDIVKKSFNQKLVELMNAVTERGEQQVFAKALTHLMYKHITEHHVPVGEIDSVISTLPDYQFILGRWHALIVSETKWLPCTCDYLPTIEDIPGAPRMSIKTFYEDLMYNRGYTTAASRDVGSVDDLNKRVFYLALLHMVVLNTKGDSLHKQHKIIRI